MPQRRFSVTGKCGTTAELNTNNDVVQIPQAALDEGDDFVAVLVTIGGNTARYGFNITPSTTLGHVAVANTVIRIADKASAKALRIRNAADGSQCEVTYTCEFERVTV
jgi:hypothetical protein